MLDPFPVRAARRTLTTLILSALLAVAALAIVQPAGAGAFEVGLADQKPAVFSDARIQALGVRYARLIVPWNAATSEPARVQAWLDAVAARGMVPHVAFEHLRGESCASRCSAAPSAAQYRAAVDAFIARFPQVRTFTTWNEANHQSQPVRNRPELVAQYYQQLVAACAGCTVVAGDVLDSGNYTGWLSSMLSNFASPPQLWGIHNYGDVQRGVSTGTDAVLATVPGTLWVEETGGIIQLRGSLSGGGGVAAAEAQAAASIDQAFTIARARPRIGRIYVYQVQAFTNDTFDSGLLRPDGVTRPGFYAFQRNLANTAAGAAAASAAKVVAPTATVRWSKASGGRVVVRVVCAAGSSACAGSVRLTVRTRGAKAKTWTTKTVATRSFAAKNGTATLKLELSKAIRQRLRRAAKRQAVARIAQVSPASVSLSVRRSLPRP